MSIAVTKEKELTHPQFGKAKAILTYNKPTDEADFEKIFTTIERARIDHGRRLAAAAFNSVNSALTADKIAAITTREDWDKLVNETAPKLAAGYTPQMGDGISGSDAKELVTDLRTKIGTRTAAEMTTEEIDALLASLRV